MDAVVGTEGAAAFGEDFEVTPTAEREAVGAFGESVAGGMATGEGAGD